METNTENRKPNTENRLRIHIRWMIRRDMPAVLAIEKASFEFPWFEEDFVRSLRQRNCLGMVATLSSTTRIYDHVIGYMLYDLNKSHIHLLNFAVDPDCRRNGVGTKMIEKLVGKLSKSRRSRIILEVRESNLDAQLFFREHGFRAVSVLRGYYDDTAEDAYVMELRYQ
jgi:ribosomal-protein-alanine N-acetyltransferase